jgi:hypothetical protein
MSIDKARVWQLMARRSTAQMARTGKAMADAQREAERASAAHGRLDLLVQGLVPLGAQSAATLRDAGLLAAALSAEAQALADQAAARQADALRLRADLALQDLRRNAQQSAADAARQARTAAAEARAEAALPPRPQAG